MHKKNSVITFILSGLVLMASNSLSMSNNLPKILQRPLDYKAPLELSNVLGADTLDGLSGKKLSDLLALSSDSSTMPFLLAEVVNLTTKKVFYCDARILCKRLCSELISQVFKEDNIKKLKLACKLGCGNLLDIHGNNLLHRAILEGNSDMVARILALKPTLIGQKNKAGQTPLDITLGKVSLLEVLYRKTINKNEDPKELKHTVLHEAVKELISSFNLKNQDLEEHIETVRCIVNEEPELKDMLDQNYHTAYAIVQWCSLPKKTKNLLLDLLEPANAINQLGHTLKKIKTTHTRRNSSDYIQDSPYRNFVELFKNFNIFVTLFTIHSLSDAEFNYVGNFSHGFSFPVSPQQECSALLLQTAYDRSKDTCINIGLLYEYGIGTTINTKLARRYYELGASHHNSAIALYKLYHFYMHNLGGTSNIALANEYYSKAFKTQKTRTTLYKFALRLLAQSGRAIVLGEQAYKDSSKLLQSLVIHNHDGTEMQFILQNILQNAE
ncbi:hypothetical protein H0X48_02185 [Candidatus Dependentiae bacterium]|nr:hypothetical protein [Candidatus Dependentiae bacterium]